MHSVLDLSLVIQMVHVVAAYWILSTFFLKPAYALVMKIRKEQDDLKRSIIECNEELELTRLHKFAELTHLQNDLVKAASDLTIKVPESRFFEQRSEKMPPPEVSRDNVVQDVVTSFKQRIIDDH